MVIGADHPTNIHDHQKWGFFALKTLQRHVIIDEIELEKLEIQRAKRRATRYAGPSEDEIQRAFVQWARGRGLLLWHTPNANGSVRRASKMKALGQLAGVADIIIVRENLTPAAIEFKTATGRVSPAQQQWLDAVRSMGWEVAVVRSVEEAKVFVLALGL